MQDELDPLKIFCSTFAISSFAGLAALLRSGKQLSFRVIASAMLNSGLLGLGLAFLWYNYFRGNVWFLMGVCLLAGLGGVTLVDFVCQACKYGGVELHVKIPEDHDVAGEAKEEK